MLEARSLFLANQSHGTPGRELIGEFRGQLEAGWLGFSSRFLKGFSGPALLAAPWLAPDWPSLPSSDFPLSGSPSVLEFALGARTCLFS